MLKKWILFAAIFLVLAALFYISRYQKTEEMVIPIEEVALIDYPEDPAHHDDHYGLYGERILRLIQEDKDHFSFIFTSENPQVATIELNDIDLSLMVPVIPKWLKGESNLEKLSLIDREWNRQQVSFNRSSPQLKVIGGDGFEIRELASCELARNCLNAGLWELLLFANVDGEKTLYYQGWFTLPLGHYKDVFEAHNQLSYWPKSLYLEHWISPEGTFVNLDLLRTVIDEKQVPFERNLGEPLVNEGEQKRKFPNISPQGITRWGDFLDKRSKLQFATFAPPGRYKIKKPWKNQYERLVNLDKVTVRKIISPATSNILDEIELSYNNGKNKLIISGIDLSKVPPLPNDKYHSGIYMPMGLSVPPVYQTYDELTKNPPQNTPYFALILNDKDQWQNYHQIGIDGPVIFKDQQNPQILHIYLLSYERHSLVSHITLTLNEVILPPKPI